MALASHIGRKTPQTPRAVKQRFECSKVGYFCAAKFTETATRLWKSNYLET